ncbi:kinetochore-associated protein NSL1 homolog [Discoglossus pictus]
MAANTRRTPVLRSARKKTGSPAAGNRSETSITEGNTDDARACGNGGPEACKERLVPGPEQPSTAGECQPKRYEGAGAPKESGACDPAQPGPSSHSTGLPRDCRVRCCSKQLMEELLTMYEEFSKELLGGQQLLSPGKKEQEHRTSAWDFETALQENISINGERWHDVVEVQNEPNIKTLEDQLDEAIVDAAMRRKKYPRKILVHVVKMLKEERKMLGKYKPVVYPQELKLNSEFESRMLDVTAMTTTISKQISETMKALPTQIEKAEGFSQVLSLQPILEGSRTRKEIFCSQVKLKDLAKRLPKPSESTPTETEPQTKTTPVIRRKRQRSLSPSSKLYPLRSKRKISLNR